MNVVPPESAYPFPSLAEFIGVIIDAPRGRQIGRPEAGEQQGEEEIEHDQIADDDRGQEKWHADLRGHPHAVPHGLDPLAAQHPEHDHEAVHEVDKVPAGHLLGGEQVDAVDVALAEQLHAHHGEDEDDDAQHQGQVAQSAHRFAHDGD